MVGLRVLCFDTLVLKETLFITVITTTNTTLKSPSKDVMSGLSKTLVHLRYSVRNLYYSCIGPRSTRPESRVERSEVRAVQGTLGRLNW